MRASSGQKASAAKSSSKRAVIQAIIEATGASEEDVDFALAECDGDVNLATNKLIDGGVFSSVVGKKQKKKQREEERRSSLQKEAAAAPKVLEVRRQPSTGAGFRDRDRGRGSRDGGRGGRGARGGYPPRGGPPAAGTGSADAEGEGAADTQLQSGQDTASQPAPSATQTLEPPPQTFSRAPAPAESQAAAPAVAQHALPVPSKPGDGSNRWADLLKEQPAAPPAAAPSAPAVQQPPQQQTQQQPPAASAPVPAPQPQLPVSQPELGTSDPVIEKGAAVAAQAHAVATAPIAAPVPAQQQQPITSNGIAADAGQPSSVQEAPQHDTFAAGQQSLGGIPVQAPPRQSAFAADTMQPTGNAWAPPQKPAIAPGPIAALGSSLGTSLMASLSATSPGLTQASTPLSDPAIVSHSLSNSGNLGIVGPAPDANRPSVVLPASTHQVPQDNNVDPVRLQFGQFGLGGDYGSSFGNSTSLSHTEPPATAFQQQATAFASSGFSSQPLQHVAPTSAGQVPSDDQLRLMQGGHVTGSVQNNSFKSGALGGSGEDLSGATAQAQTKQPTSFQHQGLQQSAQHAQAPQQQPQAPQQPAPQQQRTDIGQSFSQRAPEPAVNAQHTAPRSSQQYGDYSSFQHSGYGQQYGGAFAQGQFDAFASGSGGLGGVGDKQSSFDTAGYGGSYGGQSDLGAYGTNAPATKPADQLQGTGAGFAQQAVGQADHSNVAAASTSGSQSQGPHVHQQHQGYGPPGMGGYAYPATQYGYQGGYGGMPPNYYGNTGYGYNQGYGSAPQQQPLQQGGYGSQGPARPKQQQQQQAAQHQQFSGYGSQGHVSGKDAFAAGVPQQQQQPQQEANPYAGASAAWQQGSYGPPGGRQQNNAYGAGGYGYGYGGFGGPQGQPSANGDAFKMQ